MSLSSLYSSLHYYQGQVGYWQNSADTYTRWLGDVNEQIAYKEDQLSKANTSQSKCSALADKNEEVSSALTSLGSILNANMDEPAANARCSEINRDNAGFIEAAVAACKSLIAKLEEELRNLYAQRATYEEGISYSNGRVSYYQGCVSSTQSRIASYNGD